jgi:hypothetical protein
MARIAATAEHASGTIEITYFGPPVLGGAHPGTDSDMLLVGKWLAYVVTNRSWGLTLQAGSADAPTPPRRTLSFLPAAEWKGIVKLILALENSGLKDVQAHPLELGTGPDGWVIE